MDALLRFYSTPVGKSVAAKLPAAGQQMLQLTQQRIREMMPKMQEIVRDSAARIKAAADSGAAPAPPPQSPQQPH